MSQSTLAPARARVAEGAREASPGLVWLGRLGFTSKGVVYVLIGFLAAAAAMGRGGETTDSYGVLTHLLDAPFGPWLLGAVALGLAGYAIWRLLQAVLDPEGHGSDAKGLFTRGGYLVSAVVHAALTVAAVQLLRGQGQSGGGEGSTQDVTARLMEQPFGPWLVAVAGVLVLFSAAMQFRHALTTDFARTLSGRPPGPNGQRLTVWAGKLGHAARGVTFGIIGLFLVIAAFRQEPGEAKGIAGALNTLASQPYGPYLLAIVAIGLAAYGVYMFIEARYRRMAVT